MSNDLPQVSREFLEMGRDKIELGQTMPKQKKNGGPYPAYAKKARRDEVLRLHFDYGYSARKIVDMMKVSRNTINADVNYWYSRMEEEYHGVSTDACLAKIINRMESQRCQLREELDRTETTKERTLINRTLLDIDSRLVQFYLKERTNNEAFYDAITKRLNEWMKENKYEDRFMTYGSFWKFSGNAVKKIRKVMKEDEVQANYH